MGIFAKPGKYAGSPRHKLLCWQTSMILCIVLELERGGSAIYGATVLYFLHFLHFVDLVFCALCNVLFFFCFFCCCSYI